MLKLSELNKTDLNIWDNFGFNPLLTSRLVHSYPLDESVCSFF